MSIRSIRSAVVAGVFACALVPLAAPRCLAADAAAKSTDKKETADAEIPQKATITKADCRNLTVHVAWKGPGVTVVDYYGAGTPVLQVRQDPSPGQTSISITLGKEWGGRKIDVRIWDKDIKLLDTKSVDCKASS